MSQISIVIPTFKRPADLMRLLQSLHLDIGGRKDVHFIIADNDKAGSAKPAVDRFEAETGRSIEYVVEPNPGVSNARNAAMARVKTRYVLFLDDDMSVIAPFLDPLMAASQTLGTAITFAPIQAALPETAEVWAKWLAPLFSRERDGPTRIIDDAYGTGGCLIDLDGLTLPCPIFDPALNEVGGEDDAFFATLQQQGAKMGWCADVLALEHVPEHRTTRDYVWRRHFAFGQTPAREAADRGIGGWPAIAKWMIIGGLQTSVHAPVYAVKRGLGRPSAIGHLGRLAQGVGKIFWWDGLSPKFYGAQAQ
jgi:glycosyltransferase involved in cell wall biosynthesis